VENSKLTKAQIVEQISDALAMSKEDIHRIVNAFFEELKAALGEDRIVELRGFGTFELRTRKGREGAHNPKTGGKVRTSAHGVVVFRAGKGLKHTAWALRENEVRI